jgi:hypothetical protein
MMSTQTFRPTNDARVRAWVGIPRSSACQHASAVRQDVAAHSLTPRNCVQGGMRVPRSEKHAAAAAAAHASVDRRTTMRYPPAAQGDAALSLRACVTTLISKP